MLHELLPYLGGGAKGNVAECFGVVISLPNFVDKNIFFFKRGPSSKGVSF